MSASTSDQDDYVHDNVFINTEHVSQTQELLKEQKEIKNVSCLISFPHLFTNKIFRN